MNISKLMTFIFRNRTIFLNISKWNKRQKNLDGKSNSFYLDLLPILLFYLKKI